MQIIDWDPVSKVGIEGVEDAEELKKNSAKMAVAIGLALYDYD